MCHFYVLLVLACILLYGVAIFSIVSDCSWLTLFIQQYL